MNLNHKAGLNHSWGTVLLFSIPGKCRAFATPPVCPVCVHGITTLEPPIPKWGGAMKGTEEWSVVILKSS